MYRNAIAVYVYRHYGVSLYRGTPYTGIRILGIYKYRFGIEARVYTRPSCTAVHPQEVTLSNPKEHCERMKKEEAREEDRDRAGAGTPDTREHQVQGICAVH